MKQNDTAIFLSARNKATRLKDKELIEIHGKSVIEHLIYRLKKVKKASQIILCTSIHPDDQILVAIAGKNGINAFCGSEDDKLERYRDAAQQFDIEYIAVVDGDDLFCEPSIIDDTLIELKKGWADYVIVKDLPLGAACFGLTRTALDRVCEVKDETDTEVWGGYFTDTGIFKSTLLEVKNPALKRPDIRLTLDYQEDLDLFRVLFDRLDPAGLGDFGLNEIIDVIDNEPELVKLNAVAQSKYLEHLQTKPKIAIKKR